MIKHKYHIFLVAISFLFSTFSYAEVSDESINKLLVFSGITMQVEQFPEVVKVGIGQAKQQGTPIPDVEFSLILNSIDESFKPLSMIETIRKSIKKTINEEEAKKLLAWYQSDLGRKITRAEERASTPEAYQKMMYLEQTLFSNSEQVEFVQRLDLLLGATDTAVELHKYTGIAVYSAIMTAIQPDVPLDLEPFIAQVEAASYQTRIASKEMVTLSFLYAYRNIKIDKLREYESFLNNTSTMKFNQVVIDSMNKGFETSVSKFANALAEILKTKYQQQS